MVKCAICGRTAICSPCDDCRRRMDAEMSANQAQEKLAKMQIAEREQIAAMQLEAEKERKRQFAEKKRQDKLVKKYTTRLNDLKAEMLQLKTTIPLLENAIATRDFINMKKLGAEKRKNSGCLKWFFYCLVALFGLLRLCARMTSDSHDGISEPVEVQQ